MIQFRKPSAATIHDFLRTQASLGPTYPAVGATNSGPPAGYAVGRTRVELGKGEEVFRAARAGLERWEQFRLGWAETWPPNAPIREGEAVAVLGRSLGMWWLSACRIVYVVDRPGPVT